VVANNQVIQVNTEAVKTKIKLGDIKINGYILKDGSYAASDLFRLFYTDIYRYGDGWYLLSPKGIPDVTNCKFWGRREDVFLAFQGNKLCYLYVNPADSESELYVPIPCDINSAIEFCVLGKLASVSAMSSLNKVLGQSCLLNKSLQNRLINSYTLLSDTSKRLPKVKDTTLDAKKKKSSSVPSTPSIKKSSSVPKIPSSTFNTRIPGMPIGCDGFIYLVRLDAHLKLGFTRNIDLRLKSFETTSLRVELIKSIPGSLQDEKYLHSILGSKARELYDFKDEQRIKQEMVRVSYVTSVRAR
jgi:hypothetical protein